jgi:hypothetical protein
VNTDEKRNKKREKLIVYQDDSIIVWEASNMKECILIARDYHICTAKIGGGNLYPRYRLRFHSTFFFIRFKQITSGLDELGYHKMPLHFIIIDAQKNNIFQWGYTDNKENYKKYATPEEIVELFPSIKVLFDKSIIKNKPLSEDEKPVLNLQLE